MKINDFFFLLTVNNIDVNIFHTKNFFVKFHEERNWQKNTYIYCRDHFIKYVDDMTDVFSSFFIGS